MRRHEPGTAGDQCAGLSTASWPRDLPGPYPSSNGYPVPEAVQQASDIVTLEPNKLETGLVPGITVVTNPDNSGNVRVNKKAVAYVLQAAGAAQRPFQLILWTPITQLRNSGTGPLYGGVSIGDDITRSTDVAAELYIAARLSTASTAPTNAFSGAIVAALYCHPYSTYTAAAQRAGIAGMVPIPESDYNNHLAALCGQQYLVEPVTPQ